MILNGKNWLKANGCTTDTAKIHIKQTLKQLKLTHETIDLVRDLESDSLQDKSSHVCWVMTMRIHRKQEQKHNDSTTEMVV